MPAVGLYCIRKNVHCHVWFCVELWLSLVIVLISMSHSPGPIVSKGLQMLQSAVQLFWESKSFYSVPLQCSLSSCSFIVTFDISRTCRLLLLENDHCRWRAITTVGERLLSLLVNRLESEFGSVSAPRKRECIDLQTMWLESLVLPVLHVWIFVWIANTLVLVYWGNLHINWMVMLSGSKSTEDT